MKSLFKLLYIGIASLATIASANAASLLTFDTLPSGGPLDTHPPVPNGYGGLNWNNFEVANGLEFSTDYGYYKGVVSPSNEVFNAFGNPASVAVSSGLFDLDSAYLTAALNLNTPLQIEVQGFLGTTLLYDNTYTVSNTAPTLVNFDYIGVNRVKFISSPPQQFVMDNLTVAVPEPRTGGLLIFSALWAVLRCSIKRSTIRVPCGSNTY